MRDQVNDPKKIENGKRFIKIRGDLKDAHEIGSRGTIIDSIGPMPEGMEFAGEYGYFVHFDGDYIPVFIRGAKIEEIK